MKTPCAGMKRKRGNYCAAVWCNNFFGCRINEPISLFVFPKDPVRAVQWLRFALRDDLLMKDITNYRLCSDHFKEEDFKSKIPRTLLKSNAIPSRYEWKYCEQQKSLPEVPLLNNQERTRQLVSPPDVLQSNRRINIQLGQGNFHMIEETPEMHSLITLPCLEQAVSNLQWVYRILSGEEGCERIVYESPDKDDKNGFMLIKDSKWDGTNLDSLHLIAIAYRPGIMSLRDLGAEHLCLLNNIYSAGKAVIINRYGVLSSQLRIFLKYAPEFYHLHVHFTAMNDDICGPYFGSAQPLFSVIQNIQIFPKYYQVAKLGLCVKESDELFEQFEAKGLVVRDSTFQ